MKLKKLLASAVAAALAVTTMAVTSFTASAADLPYINLKGNTASWAFGGDGDTNKYFSYGYVTSIDEGTKTYDLTCTNTAGYKDTLDGGALSINFFGLKGTLTDISLVSVAVDGVDKNVSSTDVTEKNDLWDGTDSLHGFELALTAEQLTAIGEIDADKSVVFTVKVTYTPSTAPTWKEAPDGTYTISGACAGGDDTISTTVNITKLATAAGKTVDDIESITVTFTITGDNVNGCIGGNKGGDWASKNWDADNSTITIAAGDFDSIASLSLQLWFSPDDGSCKAVFKPNFKTSGSDDGDDDDDDDNGDTPTPPAASGSTLWTGSTAMGNWAGNVQLTGSDVASMTAGGKIKVTYEADADAQVSFKHMGTDWPALPGFKAGDGGEWGAYNITGNGTYEYTLTAEDVELIKATALIVSGKNYTLTKIEYIPAGGTTTPPVVDPTPEDPAPSTPTPTPSTPAVPNTNPAPVSQTTVIDKILATPDGGNGSVSLGSSTKLDKLTVEALATKGDVTVKFSVAGGAYWEINGKNVTDAKNVDLGVKVNSKLIPASKVEAFAGEKTSIQLSLSHNGDLGFTGTLNVPVGNSNNGKFANLYYYHGGKFDFVGSSPISGGRTQFAFSHASNYLIVIDDYAYGEDVSSAAGMTETPAETNTFPYVAVLVVIAAFGTSAIVLKKRLSK